RLEPAGADLAADVLSETLPACGHLTLPGYRGLVSHTADRGDHIDMVYEVVVRCCGPPGYHRGDTRDRLGPAPVAGPGPRGPGRCCGHRVAAGSHERAPGRRFEGWRQPGNPQPLDERRIM